MKCQIQVRGEWGGTAGDWRPLCVAAPATADVPICFASWDEAEETLDRLQRAGLVPMWPEPGGAEFRIIDIAERRPRRRSANGPASSMRV
ncbi:MAG TPA: hypothetical protein VMG12_13765 [Polyangiaceae bacterium]|nr:hypothetical protein [Polyangiaceae bacterium]